MARGPGPDAAAQGPLAWLPDGGTRLLASFSYVACGFVRFANDALSLFLGSAALAAYVVWIRPRRGEGRGLVWRCALHGALAGLAVLAKAPACPGSTLTIW